MTKGDRISQRFAKGGEKPQRNTKIGSNMIKEGDQLKFEAHK